MAQVSDITALCLGQAAVGSSDPDSTSSLSALQHILVSASREAVVLWRLAEVFASAHQPQVAPPLPEPLLVMEGQRAVNALQISTPSTGLLAVCAGCTVHIFRLADLCHTLQ
jgi:hypothetical protein